jgi:uncharacterized protein YgiM (DUF1202 family)
MRRLPILVSCCVLFTTLSMAVPAMAGDCTGFVTGIRPVSQYNPATGAGFLAVRSGPGTGHRQIGELYAGDEVAVWNRSGSWFQIRCMAGRCTAPLRGAATPTGWVFGRYLTIGGVCP